MPPCGITLVEQTDTKPCSRFHWPDEKGRNAQENIRVQPDEALRRALPYDSSQGERTRTWQTLIEPDPPDIDRFTTIFQS